MGLEAADLGAKPGSRATVPGKGRSLLFKITHNRGHVLFPNYACAEVLLLVNSFWDNGEDISRCLLLLGIVAYSHNPRIREVNEDRRIRKFRVILGYIVSLRPAWAA